MARVLIDTNVWLDYYRIHDASDDNAFTLIDRLLVNEHEICVTPLILKDLYYLVGMGIKRKIIAEKGTLAEQDAGAANEIAWSCAEQAISISSILPVDGEDCRGAVDFRSVHGDFEDDLLLAVSKRYEVSYFATYDKALRKHAPLVCATPRDIIESLHLSS